MTTTTTTTAADAVGTDAVADAAARAAVYAAGMQLLGKRPDLLDACDRAATRRARLANDAGDISAETSAGTLDAVARYVGKHGLPTDADRVAALISVAAKRAAQQARDRARAAWSPRIRTTAPTAPNTLEAWDTAKLIRHAEHYTAGDLTRGAVVTDAYRVARAAVLGMIAAAGHRVPRPITPRERAQAVIDARAESSLPMVTRTALLTTTAADGAHTAADAVVSANLSASRVNGGTVPSAESCYWRERDAWDTAAALSAAVGAPMVDRLTDAYRGKRVRLTKRGGAVGDTLRERRVSWSTAADGADRGNTRRSVKRDAGRVRPMVAAGHAAEARAMVAAAYAAWEHTAPTDGGTVVTFHAPRERPTRPMPMPWNQYTASSAVGARANPPRLDATHVGDRGPMMPAVEWRDRLTDAAGWCERGHHAWDSIMRPFQLS